MTKGDRKTRVPEEAQISYQSRSLQGCLLGSACSATLGQNSIFLAINQYGGEFGLDRPQLDNRARNRTTPGLSR